MNTSSYVNVSFEPEEDVLGLRPNLVISSCYQAAWEKLFKYMDIEPRLIQPSRDTFTIDPDDVRDAIDERTMGVVCIRGTKAVFPSSRPC